MRTVRAGTVSSKPPIPRVTRAWASRTAPEGDIKRAYRQLARKFHPDVADDKVAAENHFKEINEAYEVLSDPQKRANYDRFGHAGDQPAGFGGFAAEGFGDIFDMFFGAARGGGSFGTSSFSRSSWRLL